MPEKNKLSQSAIRFIIQTRLDEKATNNSFAVIAELVKSKFGIDVTGEACRRQFNKNVKNPIFQNSDLKQNDNLETVKSSQVVNLPVTEEESKEVINTSLNSAKPKKIDFKALRQAKVTEVDEGFDKKFGNNLSEEDLSSLLNKAK